MNSVSQKLVEQNPMYQKRFGSNVNIRDFTNLNSKDMPGKVKSTPSKGGTISSVRTSEYGSNISTSGLSGNQYDRYQASKLGTIPKYEMISSNVKSTSGVDAPQMKSDYGYYSTVGGSNRQISTPNVDPRSAETRTSSFGQGKTVLDSFGKEIIGGQKPGLRTGTQSWDKPIPYEGRNFNDLTVYSNKEKHLRDYYGGGGVTGYVPSGDDDSSVFFTWYFWVILMVVVILVAAIAGLVWWFYSDSSSNVNTVQNSNSNSTANANTTPSYASVDHRHEEACVGDKCITNKEAIDFLNGDRKVVANCEFTVPTLTKEKELSDRIERLDEELTALLDDTEEVEA